MHNNTAKWLATNIGEHVNTYTQIGFRVFPCHGVKNDRSCTCGKQGCANIGKHPACKNGLKDATGDFGVAAKLFDCREDLNIGIATGAESGIFVIDIDGDKGGNESFARLQQLHGALPTGWSVLTGNGQHHYFKHPSFKVSSNSNTFGKDFPGVDIRGDGGYVIAPPSRHRTGKEYSFASDDIDLPQDAPEAWLELLKPKENKPPEQNLTTITSELSREEVEDMLSFLDPDMGHDDWLHVGMALHHSGFSMQIWNNWSQRGRKYNPKDCISRWNKFKRDGGITIATLVKMAKGRGWESKKCAESNCKEADGEDSLPVIVMEGGGISVEATKGEEVLISSGAEIYQRGYCLVRPVVKDVEAARKNRTKIAQLIAVGKTYLVDQLCQRAIWKRRGQSGIITKINPPDKLAELILGRKGHWNFKEVVGVITTPTLRPDGSLLCKAGYDPETRLILFEPPAMPDIPDAPTREDALEALDLLNDLLSEFPFVGDASRSVALSMILTTVSRGAFNVAPMHAIRASTPGSGKSYICDMPTAIATGRRCPVTAAGKTEEETEKRIGSALLAGQPVICIDNISGEFGGDFLCQAIERHLVEIRILGKSEQVEVESRSTIFATGNNLRLLGDMTRRVVLCTLDANMERPELRKFKDKPFEKVLSDRGKYIAAALTIVRAYIVAGRPNPAPQLGSFEDWSDTVRSALIWLDLADPVETMNTARDEDPSLQTMAAVFAAMRDISGVDNKKTAADIIKLAFEKEGDEHTPYKNPKLRDALANATSNKSGFFNAKEFGKWLSQKKKRIVNNMRLDQEVDKHGHASKWWITEIRG